MCVCTQECRNAGMRKYCDNRAVVSCLSNVAISQREEREISYGDSHILFTLATTTQHTHTHARARDTHVSSVEEGAVSCRGSYRPVGLL